MKYRRARIGGGTYFFTVVTFKRRKVLCVPENVHLLRNTFRNVMQRHPFKIDAIVLLPDHLHCIWTLPDGDHNYSTRWRLIKGMFSRHCSPEYKGYLSSSSRLKKKEQAVWQRRFREHLIRDDEDFRNHVEYIHYNPVRHGLVATPAEWKYSSFRKFVRLGIYDEGWGNAGNICFADNIGCE